MSYALSHVGLAHVRHMPLSVAIEPVNYCQLRCPECPVGRHESVHHGAPQVLSLEDYTRILDQVSPYAYTLILYWQGEPLLHPHIVDMVRMARARGMYVLLSTNAQALTPALAEGLIRAGLSRIVVSLDGLSPESYAAYRVGGDVEQAKQAIGHLRAAKDRLHGRTLIELQCLRLRTNEHEWDAFRRTYRSLGADRLTFKTAQLTDYHHGHPLMPSDARYSRYRMGQDGLYHCRKAHRRTTCWRMWSGCVITTAGDVLPCCYDKAEHHTYGNILRPQGAAPFDFRLSTFDSLSLREVYTNDKARDFRSQAMHNPPAICHNCWR